MKSKMFFRNRRRCQPLKVVTINHPNIQNVNRPNSLPQIKKMKSILKKICTRATIKTLQMVPMTNLIITHLRIRKKKSQSRNHLNKKKKSAD